MRYTIAGKAVVPVGTAVSRAVEIGEANAVEVEIIAETLPGLDFAVTVQEGNDLINWTAVGSAQSIGTVGASAFERSGISGRYVRLIYSVDGNIGEKAIFQAIIETRKL